MERKNHAFKIVALGEDFGAVIRAQELSRQLAAELEPEFEISSDAWKFEELGSPQAGKAAAEATAKADMVIIAAEGTTELPPPVKGWVESWLPRKQKSVTALVALLDPEDKVPHESSPLCAYLQRLAGKCGLDFFSRPADWWKQNFGNETDLFRTTIGKPGAAK